MALLAAASMLALVLSGVAWAHVPEPTGAHHATVYGAPWAGADGQAARGSWPFEPGDGPPAPAQGHGDSHGNSNGGAGEGDHGSGSDRGGRGGRGDFGCSVDPSASNLKAAFRRTLAHFLSRARRKYGHLYYDFHRSYQITGVNLGPTHGTVTIHYSGSVKERGSGDTIHAAGGASASYKWVGCHWVNTDISY